jgi:hypothetical protein
VAILAPVPAWQSVRRAVAVTEDAGFGAGEFDLGDHFIISSSMIALNIGQACWGTTALPKHFNRFALFFFPVMTRGGS